jgi:hypothetical protein
MERGGRGMAIILKMISVLRFQPSDINKRVGIVNLILVKYGKSCYIDDDRPKKLAKKISSDNHSYCK